MKLLIAESDEDRRALLALAGLSPPIHFPPDPDPIGTATGVPRPNGWVEANVTAIAHDLAEVTELDADAEDAAEAVRVAEPSGGPFGSNHADPAQNGAQPVAEGQGGGSPHWLADELTKGQREAYDALLRHYRPDQPGHAVHYGVIARELGITDQAAMNRMATLVRADVARNRRKGSGMYQARIAGDDS
jgi:hypothetical protein